MFEIMSTGFSSPVLAGLRFIEDVAIPSLPGNVAITHIGQADNGDLIATISQGYPSIWIFRKDATGSWKIKQTINNTALVPNGSNPVPVAGGFVISSPSKPNNRGSLSLFLRDYLGNYPEVPVSVKESGDVYGSLGGYGGVAAAGDWLFSSVQFNGSFLMCFKKTATGEYIFRQKIQKPGTSLFAAHCIRAIGNDTILCSAGNETSDGKGYAGAIYHFKLDGQTDTWVEMGRIQAFAPTQEGYFGNSITPMDDYNAIATSRSTSGTTFHLLKRDSLSGPFKWTSAVTTPAGVRPYQGYNAVQGGGKMLFCGNIGDSNRGEAIVCTFKKEEGLFTYMPNMAYKGATNGEYFASNQVVIGKQVIYVSTMAGDPSKSSFLKVFEYAVPE